MISAPRDMRGSKDGRRNRQRRHKPAPLTYAQQVQRRTREAAQARCDGSVVGHYLVLSAGGVVLKQLVAYAGLAELYELSEDEQGRHKRERWFVPLRLPLPPVGAVVESVAWVDQPAGHEEVITLRWRTRSGTERGHARRGRGPLVLPRAERPPTPYRWDRVRAGLALLSTRTLPDPAGVLTELCELPEYGLTLHLHQLPLRRQWPWSMPEVSRPTLWAFGRIGDRLAACCLGEYDPRRFGGRR